MSTSKTTKDQTKNKKINQSKLKIPTDLTDQERKLLNDSLDREVAKKKYVKNYSTGQYIKMNGTAVAIIEAISFHKRQPIVLSLLKNVFKQSWPTEYKILFETELNSNSPIPFLSSADTLNLKVDVVDINGQAKSLTLKEILDSIKNPDAQRRSIVNKALSIKNLKTVIGDNEALLKNKVPVIKLSTGFQKNENSQSSYNGLIAINIADSCYPFGVDKKMRSCLATDPHILSVWEGARMHHRNVPIERGLRNEGSTILLVRNPYDQNRHSVYLNATLRYLKANYEIEPEDSYYFKAKDLKLSSDSDLHFNHEYKPLNISSENVPFEEVSSICRSLASGLNYSDWFNIGQCLALEYANSEFEDKAFQAFSLINRDHPKYDIKVIKSTWADCCEDYQHKIPITFIYSIRDKYLNRGVIQ